MTIKELEHPTDISHIYRQPYVQSHNTHKHTHTHRQPSQRRKTIYKYNIKAKSIVLFLFTVFWNTKSDIFKPPFNN